MCQSCLQKQVDQSGEQGEDREQVRKPGTSQLPLQFDALPKERGHVEVQVHVVSMVKRRQQQTIPVSVPVRLSNTQTCLRNRTYKTNLKYFFNIFSNKYCKIPFNGCQIFFIDSLLADVTHFGVEVIKTYL